MAAFLDSLTPAAQMLIGGVFIAVVSAGSAYQLWTAFTRGTIRSAGGYVRSRADDPIDFWILVFISAGWFVGVGLAAVMILLRRAGFVH